MLEYIKYGYNFYSFTLLMIVFSILIFNSSREYYKKEMAYLKRKKLKFNKYSFTNLIIYTVIISAVVGLGFCFYTDTKNIKDIYDGEKEYIGYYQNKIELNDYPNSRTSEKALYFKDVDGKTTKFINAYWFKNRLGTQYKGHLYKVTYYNENFIKSIEELK